MNSLKILDCSLRDGGYYNNWKFNIKDANKYLEQVYRSKIDYVEIGFHFFEKNKNYGSFAFVDNHLVKKLKKSKKTSLALMINGADLIKESKAFSRKIKRIFSSGSRSLNAVRIAVHLNDLPKIKRRIIELKKNGLKVFLNLMQINTVSDYKLANCLKNLQKWDCVDVFYFADSFGNLNPFKVKKICKIVKKNWKKEFGIHSHDNCGLALKNSIQAYKSGATWIDGTIQGMGRGAGNVKTEALLRYFSNKKYNFNGVKKISENYFYNLKKKYKWGTSKFYKIAAKFNIHPSYIQELNKDDRYKIRDIEILINHLSKINSKSYDPKLLEKLSYQTKKIEGSWNARRWCLGRSILIIGQGPSLKNKKALNTIKNYILNFKPIVLSININNFIPERLIDYYVTSNEKRILVEHKNYKMINKPLILPNKILKILTGKNEKLNFYDYGVTVKDNKFQCFNNYTIIPYNQSFGYAVALGIIGLAKNIVLAGFDGYPEGHLMQEEMDNTIKAIKKEYPKVNLFSVTETNYKINMFSDGEIQK